MASLDVESLFTNIPLGETIDILTEKVFGKKYKVNGISKRDFKRLLEMSTKGTVFYFNGQYYRQKDGVAMGSPLGPALANAFLAHHEPVLGWVMDTQCGQTMAGTNFSFNLIYFMSKNAYKRVIGRKSRNRPTH